MRSMVEVFIHWQAGDSLRSIVRNLGMHRNTVRELVREAERSGIRREDRLTEVEWTEFVREHFPQTVDPKARSPWFGRLDAYRQEIEQGLQSNRVSTVWGRLCKRHELNVSLATFRRYVKTCLTPVVRATDVVIHRPAGQPGEEAQVDFGRLGLWLDPATGHRRAVWAFILVLIWSRHMFVRPVLHMDKRTWLVCHMAAFDFFGAVPVREVLDNLVDGVLRADIYDPQFNPAFAELATHYGLLIDPCRVAKPTDKPHVERMVPYVRESLWRGYAETLDSLTAIEQAAERWCLEVAGQRIHRITRQRPLELFEQEEKAAMRSLPAQPWELCDWLQAKVAPDAHCAVGGALYSVPWRYLHQTLQVRLTDRLVQFYRGEEVIKTHPRIPPRHRRTDPADLPPDRIAFFQRNPRWCCEQARRLGPAVAQVVNALLEVNTLYHLRQAQGVIRLADTYGAERLDAACNRAFNFGDPSYRTVKNILAAGLERQLSVFDARPTTSAGAFLRGAASFGATPSSDNEREV